MLQPGLDDKSAVHNQRRTSRKSMCLSTYPTSIQCLICSPYACCFCCLSLLLVLSLFPPSHPLSIFSLSLQCGSLKAHCRQHLYFKDTFVSLLCIQMIRLAGRRMQLWRREGWRERREKRWRVGFWSQVSLRGDLYGPITNGGMHS